MTKKIQHKEEWMPMLTSSTTNHKVQKQDKLRYLEYYDMQRTTDLLYIKSKKGHIFKNLINLITTEENIRLAYRNIKSNDGSNTAGVDGRTIKDIERLDLNKYVELIRKQFSYYKARPVKRVEIPKPNGKTRPLGIPTIVDRLVQQCILQILEPICEAKFYEFSYGFRPNRSTENAISMCNKYMQMSHLQYVVDVDIKGFFDNVNHTKLIKQMWSMGIRDKKLICIIKAMLKAPIVMPNGETIFPNKGTPQGGILSPILSSIVLNELDWWIGSQWLCFPTHHKYHSSINKNGIRGRGNEIRALRKTKLKEIYIVRYADDFKLFCRDYLTARKIFAATKLWLNERLKLDTSDEKSKIINLTKNYSSFLGFETKLIPRRKSYVIKSHITEKSLNKIKHQLTKQIIEISHLDNSTEVVIGIKKYNSIVMGVHEYYKFATCASIDFRRISFDINKQMYNRLRDMVKEGKIEEVAIRQKYGKSKSIRFLHNYPIIPISYIRMSFPKCRNRRINKYSREGRKFIHSNINVDLDIFYWFMRNPPKGISIKMSDNILSKFSMQKGQCPIIGIPLQKEQISVLKIGDESFNNLSVLSNIGFELIASNDVNKIKNILSVLNLKRKHIDKINEYRKIYSLKNI